jgi:predicted AlkP superfamily pyrophosphatase or phosphodiesterase
VADVDKGQGPANGDHGPAARNDPPRLAVLIVFDQLRADYLTRWDDLFEEGGFHRLEREGAWFQNCHFRYASTLTAPGHASLATGCSPRTHGIVGNTWYDRATHQSLYPVYSDRYELVPLVRGKEKEEVGDWPGVWPGQLLVDTLGDALKRATDGRGRVISLSLKDRSAVLLACRRSRADACYWFFPPRGAFVTSTYYRPNGRPHPWAAQFNDGRPADRWFGRDWTRLRPDLDYAHYSGPDDVTGEGTGWDQHRTFPHPMTGGLDEVGTSYYEALGNAPFGNVLLLELAERAIDAECLGQKDTPDLLCLSFSCNDMIGHVWGPDSQEVLDVTLRSDLIVKELLDHLDAKVGPGRYVVALTADHGVCPLPEVARRQGKNAGRVPPDLLKQKAEAFLDETFLKGEGQASWVEAQEDLWIYLNQKVLQAHELKPARVEEALARWLARQPGVQRAYTRTQLSGDPLEDDQLGELVRRSFHPERSGDVAVVLKPYHILGKPLDTGTTHGSPHPYDRHVPLLVYGPGVRPGVRSEAIDPQAVASILAWSLGIEPPPCAEAPVPDSLRNRP